MKRRALCLLLSLILLISCLQICAAATSSVDSNVDDDGKLIYAPYAYIDFTTSLTSVTVGHVRSTAQKEKSSLYSSEYWGSKSGSVYSTSSHCSDISVSMALSYIGIDYTPAQIIDTYSPTLFRNTWGGAAVFAGGHAAVVSGVTNVPLETMIERYLSPASGVYSPPIIEMKKYSGGSHYVIIVGKVDSENYIALDPWDGLTMPIKIVGSNGTYTITYSKCSTGSEVLSAANSMDWWQYYNKDATLTAAQDKTEQASAKVFYCDAHTFAVSVPEAEGNLSELSCTYVDPVKGRCRKTTYRSISKEELLAMQSQGNYDLTNESQSDFWVPGNVVDYYFTTNCINSADVTALARHISGIDEIDPNTEGIIPYLNADYNRDASIDSVDLTLVARAAAGLSN